MRVFSHSSRYGPIEIICLDINDMLDDENPWWQRHNTFGSWMEYFSVFMKGKLRRQGRRDSKRLLLNRILRDIVTEFCKLMIEDLIERNDSYEFPGDQFARLQIGYKLPGTKHYRYDIRTAGKSYLPVFIFKEKAFKNIEVQYYFSLTRQWREMLEREVEIGHQYQKPDYEYDRFTERKHQLPEYPG